MALAYGAYAIVSALALIVFIRTVPLYMWRNPAAVISADAAGLAYDPIFTVLAGITFTAVAAFVGLGLFLLRARPSDHFALLVSFASVIGGLGIVSSTGALAFADPAWALPVFGLSILSDVLVMAVWLTLPDGRFVPRWSVAIVLIFGAWLVFEFAVPRATSCCGDIRTVLYVAAFAAAAATQVYRYRTVATKHQREQMKWITFAIAASVITLGVAAAARVVWPFAYRIAGTDAIGLLVVAGTSALFQMTYIGVAAALAIAILRTRLFQIDFIINRTLLYASVTVLLIGVFAGLNGLAQQTLEVSGVGNSGVVTALLAATAAAVFGPVRSRLAPFVDRLLPSRELLTLVFLDLVGSTEQAAALGDDRWRDVLGAYRALVRREVARSGGREIDNAGDGFFLVFGDPLRGVNVGEKIRGAVRGLGLDVRVGVHVGECEMRGEKPTGLAVHAAARVMSCAQAGEIVVSPDARDFLEGTGTVLVDRGLYPLKGVPGEWRLYLASPAQLTQPS